MKTLGILKEINHSETRISMVPEIVLKIKQKYKILIEKGAGEKSGFLDSDFEKAGALLAQNQKEVIEKSDIIATIEGFRLKPDESFNKKIFVGFFDYYTQKDLISSFKSFNANILALELLPRISRAQSIDALSSQANLAGYVAVLLASGKLNKIFPMMMTAAGTINPAKVLILGAGVSGLCAIATAKRLGAMVFGYDVRKAVKEQVESFGARFVDLKLNEEAEGVGGYAKELSEEAKAEQRKALTNFAKDMDVIITTAQIPGKKAPILLDDDIFSLMKKGSVIIDLAAQTGGNISQTKKDTWQEIEGVWLYGASNLSCLVPKDASFTYAKNIASLLEILYVKDSEEINIQDEIVKAMFL